MRIVDGVSGILRGVRCGFVGVVILGFGGLGGIGICVVQIVLLSGRIGVGVLECLV